MLRWQVAVATPQAGSDGEAEVLHLDDFFKKYFIYLFMKDTEREREREAETQAEGEAGSTQGA